MSAPPDEDEVAEPDPDYGADEALGGHDNPMWELDPLEDY